MTNWPPQANRTVDGGRGEAEREIDRLRSGDRAAFDRLVASHTPMVYNLILRVVQDGELAQDLTQETFIRAYRAIPRFRGGSSLSTWLYRIAHNVAVSEMQKTGHRLETTSLEMDMPEGEAEGLEAPTDDEMLDGIERSGRVGRLVRMMEALRPEQRSALMLYYTAGKSYKEISEILEMPMGTVKTLLFRAKAELRRRLRENDELPVDERLEGRDELRGRGTGMSPPARRRLEGDDER